MVLCGRNDEESIRVIARWGKNSRASLVSLLTTVVGIVRMASTRGILLFVQNLFGRARESLLVRQLSRVKESAIRQADHNNELFDDFEAIIFTFICVSAHIQVTSRKARYSFHPGTSPRPYTHERSAFCQSGVEYTPGSTFTLAFDGSTVWCRPMSHPFRRVKTLANP